MKVECGGGAGGGGGGVKTLCVTDGLVRVECSGWGWGGGALRHWVSDVQVGVESGWVGGIKRTL